MSFENFMRGVQRADDEAKQKTDREERAAQLKLQKQQAEIALKQAKYEESKLQHEIQRMTPGGPTGQATTQTEQIQPQPSAPASITPPQTAPDLNEGIQGLLMKIRQQPVASQQMPIQGMPESVETGLPPAGPDIESPYGTLPGTNKEIEQANAMQQFLQSLKMKGIEESQKAAIQKEANTFTVTDPTTQQPVSGPKELIDNLLTQSGANARQVQQQTFTAEENKKRLQQESDQRAADRASRESIAAANRLQRVSQAGQSAAQARKNQQAMTLANRFDSNAVVKNYAVLNEAVQFVSALDPNSKNPGDDIGLIYAFAKAMDPGSVVREGEYATVQKYSQSWADKFGFDVKRIFSNTQFLSPEARANMKAVIVTKANASKGSYDNLKTETEKKFKNIGEDPTGWITDYSGGSVQSGGGGNAANPYR